MERNENDSGYLQAARALLEQADLWIEKHCKYSDCSDCIMTKHCISDETQMCMKRQLTWLLLKTEGYNGQKI